VQVMEETRIAAEEADLQQALERSRSDIPRVLGESSRSSHSPVKPPVRTTEESFTTPTRLHTALAIAGAGPSSFRRTSGPQTNMSPPVSASTMRRVLQTSPSNNLSIDDDDGFGTPTTLLLSTPVKNAPPLPSPSPRTIAHTTPLAQHQPPTHIIPTKSPVIKPNDIARQPPTSNAIHPLPAPMPPQHVGNISTTEKRLPSAGSRSKAATYDAPNMSTHNNTSEKSDQIQSAVFLDNENGIDGDATIDVMGEMLPALPSPSMEQVPILADSEEEDMEEVAVAPASPRPASRLSHEVGLSERSPGTPPTLLPLDDDSSDEDAVPWSRSPSPFDATRPTDAGPSEPRQSRAAVATADWDAAQEVDAPGEENEFARFVAEVKGRDLRQVQEEIDEEIRILNQQKRAAMRDAEDVTGQTVAQIMMMLRLFGIPYMTAPMEAEAQCAALVELSLVDGIITDDSDVFLFGGLRVYKNMFNQSKTVECFLASDLVRELGLTRDTLVHLACLLGSDYIDGLPGVGPVVAMELLKEFPGEDGLHKFRDWWIRVQNGRDRPEESKSSFRKRFVRFSIYISHHIR
jgi:DNA excision repair protein ERCC-5